MYCIACVHNKREFFPSFLWFNFNRWVCWKLLFLRLLLLNASLWWISSVLHSMGVFVSFGWVIVGTLVLGIYTYCARFCFTGHVLRFVSVTSQPQLLLLQLFYTNRKIHSFKESNRVRCVCIRPFRKFLYCSHTHTHTSIHTIQCTVKSLCRRCIVLWHLQRNMLIIVQTYLFSQSLLLLRLLLLSSSFRST